MATRHWVGGAGNWDATDTTHWSATSGGAGGASAPTTADPVIFSISSGTGAVNIFSSAACSTFSINSGTTLNPFTLQGNVTFPNTGFILHQDRTLNLNNFTLSIGRYANGSSNRTRSIAFGSSGALILTSPTTNSVFSNNPNTGFTNSGTSNIRIISTAGSGVTLSINVIVILNGLNFYIPSGTFTLNATTSLLATLDFTGTYSGSLVVGTLLSTSNSLILNSAMSTTSGTAPLSLSGTATTAGVVFNFPLEVSNTTCQFQDAVTMASGKSFTIASAGTVKLAAGTTNTIDTFVTLGTTLKYLESTVSGTQATISKASGTTTVTYLSIKDSNAVGGVWDATSATNVNAGNNTGWVGLPVPPIDVLISESLSLQDASDATQNFFNVISETLGLADSSVVAAAFASAADESITTEDSPLAGTAFVSSILEDLVVADSPAVLKTFNVSISEPQTIQDAANAIAAFISDISEPTNIQESIIGVAAKIITDVTEAITTSDAQTAIVSFVSSSIESISVADNEATVKTQYAIVVEPLTLNTEQNVFAWVKIENIQSTDWVLVDNRQ